MSLLKKRLKIIIGELSRNNLMPKNLEYSLIGNIFYYVTIHDGVHTNTISDEVYCGVDKDFDIALLKCFSEYIERLALDENIKNNAEICSNHRSDGFAAYPLVLNTSSIAKNKARENAYYEAIERHVWSLWWDNNKYKHEVYSLDIFNKESLKPFLDEIEKVSPIKKYHIISPKYENCSENSKLFIVYAQKKDGGYLSGGACGNLSNQEFTLIRAFSELIRHALASDRILKNNISELSKYEQRLIHFFSGKGDGLVDQRINIKGSETIKLPTIKYDEIITNKFENISVVHRCFFEGHTDFLGGKVERLCL